jgi:uncharacterized protein YutE (UPF0331/DUF86 family)
MNLQADHERMNKLISSMRSSSGLLAELAMIPDEQFFKDEHKISSVKYNFIAAIEAIIDICNHLISRNKLRSPEDYADTFAVLCDAGILEKDFSAELMKMARFRNRLVHLYWDVDPKELRFILKTRLSDLDKFLGDIGKHIQL